MKEILLTLFLVLMVLFSSCIYFVWVGYCASLLWAWFIVPLGLPFLTLWQAVGIMIVASVFNPEHPYVVVKFTEQNEEFKLKAAVSQFLNPGLLVVFGWMLKTFFMR